MFVRLQSLGLEQIKHSKSQGSQLSSSRTHHNFLSSYF